MLKTHGFNTKELAVLEKATTYMKVKYPDMSGTIAYDDEAGLLLFNNDMLNSPKIMCELNVLFGICDPEKNPTCNYIKERDEGSF